jgi:hypothetical protein
LTALYEDKQLTLDGDGIAIRNYYFPRGTKHVPYSQIKRYADRPMDKKTGQLRMWGSGNLRHWFYLDRSRRSKTRRIVLDVGQRTRPVLTPDRPDELVAVLQEQTGMNPASPPDAGAEVGDSASTGAEATANGSGNATNADT